MSTRQAFYFLMPVTFLFLVFVLPRDWKRKRWQWVLIALYGIVSVGVFTIMISTPHIVDNLIARTFFVYGGLFFFALSCSGILISIVRYLLTDIAIQVKAWNHVKRLLKNRTYVIGVVLFTAVFLLVGSMHYSVCKTVVYDVNLSDGFKENLSQCRIGLVSDLHLGAGADQKIVDRACEKLEEMQPDVICIDGDLIDMMTYESDLEYFAERISQIHTRYGIFYVEGNHEIDSDLNCPEVLDKYGIVCLYDEAAVLDNGIAIVGRQDSLEVPVAEILAGNPETKDKAVVVLSHKPEKLKEMSEQPWLVLCGHTHGFQIPICGITHALTSDLPYGYYRFGNLQGVTTAGAAAWGYRTKWPSYNEVCLIRLVY